jgi:hypothetical protein
MVEVAVVIILSTTDRHRVEKLLLKLSGLPLKLSLTKVVSGRDTSGYATRSFNAALLPPYPFHPRPFHHSL